MPATTVTRPPDPVDSFHPLNPPADVAARLDAWRPTFRPAGPVEEWVFTQAVVASLRADACQAREQAVRTNLAARAQTCWDVDREAEVAELAAKLSRSPGRISARLKRTRHGCEWLLGRWEFLAGVLAESGRWNEEQVSLAHDLLGTPAPERDRPPWLGHKGPLELARHECLTLQNRLETALDDLDDHERRSAAAGVPVSPPTELARLRREESAWMKRFEWARSTLERMAQARQAGRVSPAAPPPPPTPGPPPSENPDPDLGEGAAPVGTSYVETHRMDPQSAQMAETAFLRALLAVQAARQTVDVPVTMVPAGRTS